MPCGQWWVDGRGMFGMHFAMSVILAVKCLLIDWFVLQLQDPMSWPTSCVFWQVAKVFFIYHGYGRV